MPAATNRHEFRVFAMKRSGHHAIMAWLMRHFHGPIYFLNNCSFATTTLFSSTRVGQFDQQSLFGGRVSIFFERGEMVEQIEHLRKDELLDDPLLRLRKLVAAEDELLERSGFPTERDAYLFNLEDFDLCHMTHVPFDRMTRGLSKTNHELIVLRDPYNWLASRYKGNFPINQEIIDAWKSHCRETLQTTRFLDHPVTVNYDRWFVDGTYRQQLSNELGLSGPEPGIGEMTNFGGGSSFSGMEFRSAAEQMDVLNRWRVFEDDPDFQRIFVGQEELIELANQLFPTELRPGFLQ